MNTVRASVPPTRSHGHNADYPLMPNWAHTTHHVFSFSEAELFWAAVAVATFQSASTYRVYLALEPYVRRHWPTVLIGWTRMLSGRLRDRLVARQVLIGIAVGALVPALNSG